MNINVRHRSQPVLMTNMSLTNNKHYSFPAATQQALQFLSTHSLELFSVSDMIQATNPNEDYVKVYINFPNKGIVAHKPICPDKTNIGPSTDGSRCFWPR